MIVILLFAQISQCILSSRCTKISSPCFTVERDVIPGAEITQRMNRSNSEPSEPPRSLIEIMDPTSQQMKPSNENNV